MFVGGILDCITRIEANQCPKINVTYHPHPQKQDCIPVGCVPPARWPYLPACTSWGGVSALGVCVCVCSWGVSAPGGGLSAPGGVSAPGELSALGGVCSGGRGCTWSWGGSAPGGCLLGGDVCSWGVYLVPGGTWSGTPPPVDRCMPVNILSCPKLRLQVVITKHTLTHLPSTPTYTHPHPPPPTHTPTLRLTIHTHKNNQTLLPVGIWKIKVNIYLCVV